MIAIVDYKAGNLTSVRLAFEEIKVQAEITGDPGRILAADRIVFPGVGAAGAAMKNLNNLGLKDVLHTVAARGTPFLGICLGTQIIFDRSEEDNGVDCLGILSGTVKLFKPPDRFDKVPQMGWNSVDQQKKHAVLDGIANHSEFYFVHSYYPAPADPSLTVAATGYAGISFASVVGRGNVVATQFHPEKSGRVGLKLLENFCKWNP